MRGLVRARARGVVLSETKLFRWNVARGNDLIGVPGSLKFYIISVVWIIA